MSGSSAGSEAELEFKNEDGQTLYGTVLDAGTPDLCMLCHGLGSDRNGAFLPALAEALRKQKISTFRQAALAGQYAAASVGMSHTCQAAGLT